MSTPVTDAALGGPGLPARTRLAALPTPLTAAPRLAAALGIGSLQVKRDDLTGFAFGGNKARPLEFLVAAAREQSADTLVTGGSAGSNFCAAAAAAAAAAGFSCHLVIAGEPGQQSPGLSLATSWGASVTWTRAPGRDSVDAELPRAAARLAARGHWPYVMPRGGATTLGAVGYALAAGELNDQLSGRERGAGCVVVAAGSGGTLAGLVAGNVLLGRPWRLVGASVSRPPAEVSRRVLELASGCVRRLARPGQGAGDAVVTARDFELIDARGPGHGLASEGGRQAAATAIATEGIVVDPVYTAKALSVVASVADRRGTVFWHTGGLLDAIAAAQEARR